MNSTLFWDNSQQLKLQVHPWTLQDDKLMYTKDTVEEYHKFFEVGVQGIFVEFPHTSKTII